ncbi:hypothetical protein BVRB_3g060670 [Beta vulgaris subsp. vulgaris]|nr:hypothetical protein BVRB_3g060670 [Beta vulgaris subsp. vulgaris]
MMAGERRDAHKMFDGTQTMYNGALQLALQGERKWRATSYPTIGLLGVSWVSLHGDTLQKGSWGDTIWVDGEMTLQYVEPTFYCNYFNSIFFMQPFNDLFYKN